MDKDAFNYNALANTETPCIDKVWGCIDKNAINTDADANTDDGSCIDPIIGCMDKDAFNYM